MADFNARASHYDDRYFLGHNLPAARARELIKPSADSASLIVSIEKKLRRLGLSVDVVISGVFCAFLAKFSWPWAPTQSAIFWFALFVEYRLSSESFEPLIGSLAHLEKKLWLNNQKW